MTETDIPYLGNILCMYCPCPQHRIPHGILAYTTLANPESGPVKSPSRGRPKQQQNVSLQPAVVGHHHLPTPYALVRMSPFCCAIAQCPLPSCVSPHPKTPALPDRSRCLAAVVVTNVCLGSRAQPPASSENTTSRGPQLRYYGISMLLPHRQTFPSSASA